MVIRCLAHASVRERGHYSYSYLFSCMLWDAEGIDEIKRGREKESVSVPGATDAGAGA